MTTQQTAAGTPAGTPACLPTLDLASLMAYDSSDLDEAVEAYGEYLWPLLVTDDKAKFDSEKVKNWLNKLLPKMRQAAARRGFSGALEVLKQEGLHVEVSVSGSAQKALQLEPTAKFNWSLFFKWVGGAAAVAVVAYGTYRLYVHWQEGGRTSAGGTAGTGPAPLPI